MSKDKLKYDTIPRSEWTEDMIYLADSANVRPPCPGPNFNSLYRRPSIRDFHFRPMIMPYDLPQSLRLEFGEICSGIENVLNPFTQRYMFRRELTQTEKILLSCSLRDIYRLLEVIETIYDRNFTSALKQLKEVQSPAVPDIVFNWVQNQVDRLSYIDISKQLESYR